jgi:hypothetical protein
MGRELPHNRIVQSTYIVTLVTQVLMAATNAGLAFILARHFGGLVFNEYIAITSIVLAFSQAAKGFQATTAIEFALGTHEPNRVFHRGDGLTLLFGTSLFILWFLASPLILSVLQTSPISTVSAGLLLPAATLGYRAAGKYQGTLQFSKWQIATCLTSMLQIPIIAVVLTLRTPLSVFILALAIPSTALFLWATFDTRNVTIRPITHDGCLLRFGTSNPTVLLKAKLRRVDYWNVDGNIVTSHYARRLNSNLWLIFIASFFILR